MKIVLSTLTLACVAMLAPSPSFAADQGSGQGMVQMRSACKEDVHSFCADIQPGGGRIYNCLEDHYKDISNGCYAVVQKIRAHHQAHGDKAPPPPSGDDHAPPPSPPSGDNDGNRH